MSDEPDYYHTFVDIICSFNTEPVVAVQNAEEHESISTPGPPMADYTFVDLICSFNKEPVVAVRNAKEHESISTPGPPMADHTLPSNDELTIFNIAPEEGFSDGSAGSSDPGVDEFSTETSVQANYSLKWNDCFTKPNPVWNIENNESTFTTESAAFNVAPEDRFSYNAITPDPPIEFSLETPYLTSHSSEEPSIRLQTASEKFNYLYGTFIIASGLDRDRYSSSLMMQEFSDEVESFESQANNSTPFMVNESLGVYSFESPSDFENWNSYQQTESYTSFEIPPGDHTLLSAKENIGQLITDYNSLPSHQLCSEQSANGNAPQGDSTRVPIEAAPGDSLQSVTLISRAPNEDKRSLRDIVESYPLVQHSGPDNRPIYGRLFCENCPHLAFSSTPELYAHYIRVHRGVPKLRCWKCSRIFHVQDKLIKHLRSAHCDKKGYKCSMCPAEFSHLEDFLTHEQRMHVELWPILCNICPQRFYSPATLEYHLYLFHPQRKPS